jgi:hypothetical protein
MHPSRAIRQANRPARSCKASLKKLAVRQHEGLLEVELTGDIADAPLEDIDLHEMRRASRLVKVVSGIWFRVRLQR